MKGTEEERNKKETNQENGENIRENRDGSKDEAKLHGEDEEKSKTRMCVESISFLFVHGRNKEENEKSRDRRIRYRKDEDIEFNLCR